MSWDLQSLYRQWRIDSNRQLYQFGIYHMWLLLMGQYMLYFIYHVVLSAHTTPTATPAPTPTPQKIKIKNKQNCTATFNKASEDARPHLMPNRGGWQYRNGHQRADIRPTPPKMESCTSMYTMLEINWVISTQGHGKTPCFSQILATRGFQIEPGWCKSESILNTRPSIVQKSLIMIE